MVALGGRYPDSRSTFQIRRDEWERLHRDFPAVVSDGMTGTRSYEVARFDHPAAPEWETSTASDLCDVCGWPVSLLPGGWFHDAKNPCEWTDKRQVVGS